MSAGSDEISRGPMSAAVYLSSHIIDTGGESVVVAHGPVHIEAPTDSTVGDAITSLAPLIEEVAATAPGVTRRAVAMSLNGQARCPLAMESPLLELGLRSGDDLEIGWVDTNDLDDLDDLDARSERGGRERRSAVGERWATEHGGPDEPGVSWRLGRPSIGSAFHPARLECGSYRVGRDPLVNDVVVDHVSVSRQHAVLEVGDQLMVRDQASTNGTALDGTAVRDVAAVTAGSTLRFGDVEFEITCWNPLRAPTSHAMPADGAAALPIGLTPSATATVDPQAAIGTSDAPQRFGEMIAVRRPPKMHLRVEEQRFVAPRPPAQPAPPRIPWISGLIPALMGVVMMGIMWASGGGAAMWTSGVFFLMSPVLVFGGYAESKRHRRADLIAAQRTFERNLNRVVASAQDARSAEAMLRDVITPSASTLLAWPRARHPRLWEAADDPDAPLLRIGTGRVTSQVVIAEAAQYASGELSDDLAARYRRLATEFTHHDAAAVTMSLPTQRVVGVAAPRDLAAGVARSFVVQTLTMLPPSAVEVVVLWSDDDGLDAEAWSALGWLSDGLSWWSNAVVSDPNALRRCIDELAVDEPPAGTIRLVIVDNEALSVPELDRLVASTARAATRLVWCGESRNDAPAAATTVIERNATGEMSKIQPHDATSVAIANIETVSSRAFERWARDMAPLREAVASGPLVASGTMAEGLGQLLGEDVLSNEVVGDAALREDVLGHDVSGPRTAIARRWARSDGSLAAPLGTEVGTDAEVVIDLVADGPHALVAGTTGAGKSELLRTMLASIAATHPPTLVTFLLVDYKGGSAFGELSSLPHSVGLITDLDEHLVGRVLASLSGEIRRREHLLREVGALDLDDFRRRCPQQHLPRLVVAIDEFASIAADVPDFLDGMVDIGRRGRSLGLHLVLATQRPTGVVTDHLRANVNLRIALRVTDVRDSEDIVGVRDAAAIDRATPGRAIVQIGQGEPFSVQAAYVGARRPASSMARAHAVRVRPIDANAHPPAPRGDVDHDLPTDLARLVAHITSTTEELGIDSPRRPWREPVAEDLGAGEVLRGWPTEPRPLSALLGVGDDPDHQRQFFARVDLDGTALAVFSADLDAAWALVELMALSATRDVALEDLRIDVIDAGGRHGSRIEALGHVGSVIAADDHERIDRLLTDLETTAPAHSTASQAGASRKAPHRVVIVHHIASLTAAANTRHARANLDRLERIIVDGRALGVTVVVSADRRRSVPYDLLSVIGHRFVMGLVDESDYNGLDEAASRIVTSGVRRGCFRGLAVQVPQPLADDELRAVVAERNDQVGGRRHQPVAALAETVSNADVAALLASGEHEPGSTWRWPVGIDDRTLGAAFVDLNKGNLLIAGSIRSGKTTVLAALCAAARRSPQPPLVVGIGIDDTLRDVVNVFIDAFDTAAFDAVVDAAPWQRSRPTLVVVDDIAELDDLIVMRLDELVAKSRRQPLRVIVAAEPATIRTAYGTVIAQVRRERHMLLLSPDPSADDDIAGVPLVHGSRYGTFGRAEYVARNTSSLIALALDGAESKSGG